MSGLCSALSSPTGITRHNISYDEHMDIPMHHPPAGMTVNSFWKDPVFPRHRFRNIAEVLLVCLLFFFFFLSLMVFIWLHTVLCLGSCQTGGYWLLQHCVSLLCSILELVSNLFLKLYPCVTR